MHGNHGKLENRVNMKEPAEKRLMLWPLARQGQYRNRLRNNHETHETYEKRASVGMYRPRHSICENLRNPWVARLWFRQKTWLSHPRFLFLESLPRNDDIQP